MCGNVFFIFSVPLVTRFLLVYSDNRGSVVQLLISAEMERGNGNLFLVQTRKQNGEK